jgi:hypothetical protein
VISRGERLLLLITGFMDLAWLYAWAVFTTSPLIHGVLPLASCAAVFWAAALLVRLVGNRGWRVITVGLVNLTGLVLGALVILHGILAPHHPFWRVGEWLGAAGSWDVKFPGFTISVVCFWILCFWAGGMRLSRRPANYHTVTSRFDLGLGAFFLLYMIQLLVRMKYGVSVRQDMAGYLMLSFFAFGVFAVGLARSRTRAEKSFRGGYRGAGLLLGFTLLVSFAGTGAALMVLPHLTGAARAAYTGMRTLGTRVEPILTRIVRFTFQPVAGGVSPTGDAGAARYLTVPEASGRVSTMGLVLLWALLGVVGAVLLYLLGRALWPAIRRLFLRTGTAGGAGRGFYLSFDRLVAWWHAVIRLLCKRRDALGVLELYTQMVVWGRRSGIPRAVHETPLEYGARLAGRFPDAGPDFRRIVDAFNLTVYAQAPEELAGLREARGSWRRLLRLWLWMARLRSLWRTGWRPG